MHSLIICRNTVNLLTMIRTFAYQLYTALPQLAEWAWKDVDPMFLWQQTRVSRSKGKGVGREDPNSPMLTHL